MFRQKLIGEKTLRVTRRTAYDDHLRNRFVEFHENEPLLTKDMRNSTVFT